MAELTTFKRFRGLTLSAVELQQITDWPNSLIEDYLSITDDLIIIADEVDTKNNILKLTTLITTSPYTPLAAEEELFIDTNAGAIIINLPQGIDGTNYRMINIGSLGNDVMLVPYLTENLFGENKSERIADSEVLIMTFKENKGWY